MHARAPLHAVFGVNEAELAADVARKLRLGGIAAAQAAAQAAPPQSSQPSSSSSQPGGAGPRSRGGSAGAARGDWNSTPAPPEPRGGAELVLAKAGLREVPREVWDAGPSLTKLDLSGNPVGGVGSPRV